MTKIVNNTGSETIEIVDARVRSIIDTAKVVFGFNSDEQALRYAHSLLAQAVIAKNLGGSLSETFNGIVINIQPDENNLAFVQAGEKTITAQHLVKVTKEMGGEIALVLNGQVALYAEVSTTGEGLAGINFVPKAATAPGPV